jgi:Spy/CpxP family protein refolding chaperone
MKRKILMLTLAALLGAGGLFVVNVQAQAAGARRAPGALLQRAKERLGLTDDQAAQIRAVLKEERQTLADLARTLHDGHVKLRAAIQKDDATEADIRAAAADLARAQADMAVERHRLFGKIKPILTPGQLDKLAKVQEKIDDLVDGAIGKFAEKLAE